MNEQHPKRPPADPYAIQEADITHGTGKEVFRDMKNPPYPGFPMRGMPPGGNGADERTPEAPGVGYSNNVPMTDNYAPPISAPAGWMRKHGKG